MRMCGRLVLVGLALGGCKTAVPPDSQFASEYADVAVDGGDALDVVADLEAGADGVEAGGVDAAEVDVPAADVPDIVPDVPVDVPPDIPPDVPPDVAKDVALQCSVAADCAVGKPPLAACSVYTCTNGSCATAPAAIGTACDDGDACTDKDACAAAGCKPGPALNCTDAQPCTDDGCDKTKGCQYLPNTAPCTDNDACTAGDKCGGGECVAGVAVGCDDKNPCTTDSCDTTKGCQTVATAGACSDGNACTGQDACVAGLCKGGPPPLCDDKNPCTTDACDPVKGCVAAANAVPCTDDDACTAGDKCGGGGCVAGVAVGCDDKNPCTDDSCAKATGCKSIGNTKACDDGDACTDQDVCAGGVCKAGVNVCCKTAADCDDKNACTFDACLASNQCGHSPKPDGGLCDDGSVCSGSDACKTGKCVGPVVKNCDDGNACTDDSCHAVAGCKSAANTVSCSDGNACTAFDGCVAGACAGLPTDAKVDCDDGNLCTTDTCVPATGCKPVAVSCDDLNDCTADSCDKVKGCVYPPAADKTACNQSYCVAGACACAEQYVAIDVDVDGVKKIVCAPDYPVWGVQADSPVGIYTVNGDGTVADSLTGRTWQQGVPAAVNWAAARSYCDQLVLAGKGDWRLPTVTELWSLVDFAKLGPAVNATAFPGVQNQWTWSATAYSGSSSGAWGVDFHYGYSDVNVFASTYRVRCVR